MNDAILKTPRLLEETDEYWTYGYKMHSFQIDKKGNKVWSKILYVYDNEDDLMVVYSDLGKKELIEMAVDFIDRRRDGTNVICRQ